MSRTLIYYMPEYCEVAEKIRDNYIAHDHKEVDIISEAKKDTKAADKAEKKTKKIAIKEKKLPDVKTIKAVVAGDKKATDKVIGMYEDEILKEMESKLKPLYTYPDGTENEMLKAELKKQIEDGLRTELPKFPMDKPVKAEKKTTKAKADKKEVKAEKKDTKKAAKPAKKAAKKK